VVNRALLLTLWAPVVAEVLGFEHDEALTLGGAVAGLNAYSKGASLGLFQPTPKEVKEQHRSSQPAEPSRHQHSCRNSGRMQYDCGQLV